MRHLALLFLTTLTCFSSVQAQEVQGTVAAGDYKVFLRYGVGIWDEKRHFLAVYFRENPPSPEDRKYISKARDMYFTFFSPEQQIRLVINLKNPDGPVAISNLDGSDVGIDFERFPPRPSSWARCGHTADLKMLAGSLKGGGISGHYQGSQSWPANMNLPYYQWNFKFKNLPVFPAVKMGEQVPRPR